MEEQALAAIQQGLEVQAVVAENGMARLAEQVLNSAAVEVAATLAVKAELMVAEAEPAPGMIQG